MPYEQLLSELKPSGCIVCVNNRLSISLKEIYFKIHCKSDAVTPSPHIVTLDQLVVQLWQKSPEGVILSPLQQQLAWQQVWYQHHGDEIDNLSAQLSYKAHSLVEQWLIQYPELQNAASSYEQQCFNKASAAFQQTCLDKDWFTQHQAMQYLCKHFSRFESELPESLTLLGFDSHTPLQQLFLDQIEQRIPVQQQALAKNPAQIQLSAETDNETEINSMCRWAKQQALKGLNIACIVPNLQQDYPLIVSHFGLNLSPENLFTANPKHDAFNISAGVALTELDIIKTALMIFEVATVGLTLDNISYLFNSPYLHESPQNMLELAKLDMALHKSQCPKPAIAFIQQLITRHKSGSSSSLAKWNQFFKIVAKDPCIQGPVAWVNYFKSLLQLLQWASFRSLNSGEHQAIQSLHQALDEIAKCELLQLSWSGRNAFTQISNHLQQCIYQPEGHHSRIQILGALEATTMQFDAAWIMGMSDQQWPQMGDANPFISIQLQQKYSMPHCSVEKDIHYAALQMQHLKSIAPEIVFSYPQERNNSRTRATAAISTYPIRARQISVEACLPQHLLEERTDSTAPTIEAGTHQSGGSVLFKHFSQCPFKAFAKVRLNARSYPKVSHGIQAIDKGNIIHKTLEAIWKQLRNQQTLLKLKQDERDALIAQHLDHTLKATFAQHPYPATHQVVSLERERIFTIIRDWLSYESQRTAFKVVACEESWTINIDKMNLNIKIDRVDLRDDGSIVIIDYKSGEANSKHWLTKPLKDPQLPLYSLYTYEGKANIAFAHLKTNEIKLNGISQLEDDADLNHFSKLDKGHHIASWTALQESWQMQLNNIADQFRNGNASVKPLLASSCQHCDLHALCRIKQWKKQQH